MHNFALPKSMEAELPQADAPDEGDSAEAAERVTQASASLCAYTALQKPLIKHSACGLLIRYVQEITQHISKTCAIEVQAEGSVQRVGIQGRMQDAAQLRVRIAAVKVLAALSFTQMLLC